MPDTARTQLEELNKFVQSYGAGGLLTFALGGGCRRYRAPDFGHGEVGGGQTHDPGTNQRNRAAVVGAKQGDLILAVAGKPKVVDKSLGELRKEMGARLGLADPNLMAFAFILNFPLFHGDEEEKKWEPEHHPFVEPW